VKVNGVALGRKYFALVSVSDVKDILAMIKWSKQSLMIEYVKNLVQKFDCQQHINAINKELEIMIQKMNENIHEIGNVELSYTMSDVLEMVQKTDIVSNNQVELEDKNSYELLTIFFNLLERTLEKNPQKTLVLVENIDHLISQKEYVEIVEKLRKIVHKYDAYFVLSTSLDGYVKCDEYFCSGIKIFGDVDFQMPEFEEMLAYVNNSYPCNKEISAERLKAVLIKIMQKIGQYEFLNNIEESVICKLINQTLMIHKKMEIYEIASEIAFLKS